MTSKTKQALERIKAKPNHRGDMVKLENQSFTVFGDDLRLIEEALAALEKGGWQPIETAPKDGEWIMTILQGSQYNGEPYIPAITMWDLEGWIDENHNYHHPTHWKPLPAPTEKG